MKDQDVTKIHIDYETFAPTPDLFSFLVIHDSDEIQSRHHRVAGVEALVAIRPRLPMEMCSIVVPC
jgi:hypothetical protein